MSAAKYCPDPDNCGYSDCPTAFCDRNASTHSSAPACSEERENLRAAQADGVMPLIGGLLSAWDSLTNDLRSDPELELLKKQIELIDEAMENPQNKQIND